VPEIQKLSVRHEAILDFLIANPTVSLGDVATKFGVTQPWLSCIIHSDAFQTKLREKQDVMFHHTVLPLREKMTVVAHMALDKVAQLMPLETELKTVQSVADSVLDRLGFGAKAPAVQINNTQNVQVNTLASELEEARKLIGKAPKPQLQVVIDGSIALPLSETGEATVGADSAGEKSALQAAQADESISETGT
jgi:hypothetical protein